MFLALWCFSLLASHPSNTSRTSAHASFSVHKMILVFYEVHVFLMVFLVRYNTAEACLGL